MLWVTRHKPHVDRCTSAWLIKRFIDKEAVFEFVSKEAEIPKAGIGFTLPKAQIKPVKGTKTTFDVLLEKYKLKDPVLAKIKEIVRDYEFNEESHEKLRLKETLGVCYILQGLEKTSQTDCETVSKAIVVMDALYATLKEQSKQMSTAPAQKSVSNQVYFQPVSIASKLSRRSSWRVNGLHR